jgi:rare lipoprotein A (peptidoglycan hydrolase)
MTAVTYGGTSEPIKPLGEEAFSPVVLEQVHDDFALIVPTSKPKIVQPEIEAESFNKASAGGFLSDPDVSWYGPNFYGKRTACGLALTKTLLGVAHKSLPCGTLVTFKHENITITIPVVDRGPYVAGRQWDLTGGACVKLNHCFTGQIYYRIE